MKLIELKPGWCVRVPEHLTEAELFWHLQKFRFDPVSLALVAVTVAGTIQQGMAAKAEAKGAENMANYKAALAQQKAKEAQEATRYKQMRMAEDAARRQSALENQLAGSGAVAGEGAPLMIAAQQAFESERDILMVGREGAIDIGRAKSEAAQHRMSASTAKARGKNVMTAAGFKAGRSLITGFSDIQTEFG